MDLGLKGKTAVVTGGGTGIGAGISEALAEEGVNVAINYIVDKEQVQAFAEDLNSKYGTSCTPFYGDITKTEDIDTMLGGVKERYGRLDILVNNAGIWPTEDLLDMPDENWQRVIDINLNGPYLISKRFAKSVIGEGKKGVIINISSKSSMQVNTSGHGHYVTAKAGLNMFTRAISREITSQGIRVLGLMPGMVRTPMNEDKWKSSGLMDDYVKRIPVGKFAEAVEIGYAVAFFASNKASNFTGTTIDITGGMLI
jgi:NAD(P)-dependent dehydrogenase (short-subunit alcohol dehydrogenase family)